MDYEWRVPSRIAYKGENGKTCTKDEWGFRATSQMKSYNVTKLLLDNEFAIQSFDDPITATTKGPRWLNCPAGKTAVDVCRDYLEHIYQYIISRLEQTATAEVLSAIPIEFWFSNSARWSNSVRNTTITAAKQAGFGSRPNDRLYMIPEPEAAVIATLRHYTSADSAFNVRIGDDVLICDCGSETVETTTYCITSVMPLEFDKLVVGTGAKCGATSIDLRFHEWMINKFGGFFRDLPFEMKGPGSRFMREFELYKNDFTIIGGEQGPFELYLVMNGAGPSPYYDAEGKVVRIYP